MEAHVPTMLAAILATDVALAISIAVGTGRDGERCTGPWSLALLVHAPGMLALVARGVVPDWFSVLEANTAISVSLAVCLPASRCFPGMPVSFKEGDCRRFSFFSSTRR